MPYFDVDVEETRHYTVRYRVFANSSEQAITLANDGESESEDEVRCNGVFSRTVNGAAKLVPAFIRVEYDRNYCGGDYSGVGEFIYLPEANLTDENIKDRFHSQTGLDPTRIVHYSLDETYDAEGDLLEG